jgi:hypothetical protein
VCQAGPGNPVFRPTARRLHPTEAIAELLNLSYGAVEKKVAVSFTKLDLPQDAAGHRRVLAVLRHLGV